MSSARARAVLFACALPAALILAARPAAAGAPPPSTTYFPQNATINYAVNGNAVVGYADGTDENNQTNGTSPTVNLVAGGSVVNTVSTFNASTFNMSGGTVYRVLPNGYPSDNSTVNISGGTVSFLVAPVGGGAVNISGGSFDLLGSAAIVGVGSVLGTTAINVSGGTFSGGIDAVENDCTVTVRGGTFGTGGGLLGVGNIDFVTETAGAFTFIGTGLAAVSTGTDANIGGTDYTLTGFLQDGSSVTGDVINVQPGAAMFTLDNVAPAPEPSQTVALGLGALGLSALALRARRRPTVS